MNVRELKLLLNKFDNNDEIEINESSAYFGFIWIGNERVYINT